MTLIALYGSNRRREELNSRFEMNNLAFVIVNYCGAKDTLSCVESIQDNIFQGNIYVYITDNASPSSGFNELVTALQANHYSLFSQSGKIVRMIKNNIEICIIKNGINIGFGGGNNAAIKILKSDKKHCDACVLLNNDTVVPSDFCSKLCSFLTPYSEGKIAFSVKSINYYTNEIDSEGFGYINMLTGRSSHRRKYQYSYLVGSCIVMSPISQIPYFDEEYFLYYEDADYSNKLRNLGFVLKYDKDNYFLHKVSQSSKKNQSIEMIKKQSMMRFMQKNGSTITNILFFITRFIVYAIQFRYYEIKRLLKFYARAI